MLTIVPPRWILKGCVLFFGALGVSAHGAIDLLPNGSIYQDYFKERLEQSSKSGRIGSQLQFADGQLSLVQTQSRVDNHTIVTVQGNGTLQVWFYANSFLGYVEPTMNSLLYCEHLVLRKVDTGLIDCFEVAGAHQIDETLTYPGTSQKVVGPNKRLFNSDGSLLRNEGENWLYKNSGRPLDYPQGSFSNWDDREEHYAWPSGILINNPVSKSRHYEDGSLLADHLPEPAQDFSNRQLIYRDGKPFALGQTKIQYPNGQSAWAPLLDGDGRVFIYPEPKAQQTLLEERAVRAFARLYYPSGVVAKEDHAPFQGSIQGTDGNSTTEVLYSADFALQMHVSLAADSTSDVLAIVREETDSVAAFLRMREPAPNPLNLRVDETQSRALKISWNTSPRAIKGYKIVVKLGHSLEFACHEAGESLGADERSLTLEGFTPDSSYTIHLCEDLSGQGSFDRTSILSHVATLPELTLSKADGLAVEMTSHTPAYRYRLEQSEDLKSWTRVGLKRSSPENSKLRWTELSETNPTQFYRVKKLAPFEADL
jgi:hypothetical protein